MDVDENKTIIDVILFKTIGLYHILSPVNSSGCFCYRTVVLTFIRMSLVLQSVQFYRLYLVSNDLSAFTFLTVVMVSTLWFLYKGHVVVTKADKMFAVLDVARYAFTSAGHQHSDQLQRYRDTLSTILRMFAGISYAALVFWVLSPGVINAETVINDEPTTIVAVRKLLFVFDAFVFSVNAFCWVMFDCYMVTVCFVFTAHFRTLSVAYRTLGHVDESSTLLRTTASSIPAQKIVVKLDEHRDLIRLIQDNQKIIK